MNLIFSCFFNIDTACVEVSYSDGTLLSIDTIAVENEVADTLYDRSELDYLLYNKPLEYAQLVMNGSIAAYIRGNIEHKLVD